MSDPSPRGGFGKDDKPRSGYTDGTIDDFLVRAYQRQQGRGTFAAPGEKAVVPEVQNEDARPEEAKPEESRRHFKDQAHQRIESILTLRTFVLLAGSTIVLALYIYNVISINRLAGEAEQLRQHVDETRSLNTILETRLHNFQRVERISSVAYEDLGLRVKTEIPIELEQ
jgi:hypothetical protein